MAWEKPWENNSVNNIVTTSKIKRETVRPIEKQEIITSEIKALSTPIVLTEDLSIDMSAPSSGLDRKPNRFASASDILVGTTGRAIIDFTPASQGNFLVYLYVRILNADSKISIQLYYSDVGSSQTQVIIDNSVPTSIGSYSISPIFINSISAPIQIIASSDQPNTLFVSASIVGL